MASNEYDVIVIGAGYGGTTCAALLAKQGLRVVVVDKNPHPGGKAMTIRKDGHAYELWPIVGGPSESGRFQELVKELDMEAEVELSLPETAGEIRYIRPDGSVAVVPMSARPSADPMAAMRTPELLGATADEAAAALKIATAIFSLSEAEIDALDDVDAESWYRSFGLSGPLLAQQFASLNLIFVVPVDRLPVSEVVRTMRDFYGGGAGRYHKRGYGFPAEAAIDYVVRNGGEYRPRTRVERVIVEDGRAVGIVAGGEELRARAVISNAGIQPTVLGLAGPDAFPAEYVETVRNYEPSLAFVGIRYFTDAPVVHTPMILQFSDESWWNEARYRACEVGDWPEHPMLFVVTPALHDPTLSPDGRQAILAGTMCSPDPKSPMNEDAVRQVDAAMHRWFPDLAAHTVRQETYTAQNVSAESRDAVVPGMGGECIGLAQVIGQAGRAKPDPRTPLGGLYLVGCDAGGYGCGTHQAVDSGFNVADLVAGDLSA